MSPLLPATLLMLRIIHVSVNTLKQLFQGFLCFHIVEASEIAEIVFLPITENRLPTTIQTRNILILNDLLWIVAIALRTVSRTHRLTQEAVFSVGYYFDSLSPERIQQFHPGVTSCIASLSTAYSAAPVLL